MAKALAGAERGSGVRTTDGKPVLDRRIWGRRDLGERACTALSASGRDDSCTHGFHTWPAGLHPQTASDLLAFLPGRQLLDPFCGGGTTLVEGMLRGRVVVGSDLSPVAVMVASARTLVTDEALRTSMRSAARKATERAMAARALPAPELLGVVGGWYQEHVLWELESLRADVTAVGGDAGLLLRAVFSSILIKASHRVSDTSSRREATDRPPGTTATLFHKKARELGRRLEAFAAAVPRGTPSGRIQNVDARSGQGAPIVDCVLTSPPYPAVYDYLPIQDLRHAWLGMSSQPDCEIGPRRSFRAGPAAWTRWESDTRAWMGAVDGRLAPGGAVAIVIGDGLVETGPIDTHEPTIAAARTLGWSSVAGASVRRPDHARDTGRWEHVLLFEKPRAR